ncbi:MAG: hypothetical protein EP307_00360 [Rhodobacteraceae bacterium]|nr:MAG: hypothetical protein EP307_00360 [Paracoccaceae bacterium]
MDTDLALIVGLILGAFSLIGAVGAITEGRAARATALSFLIAGSLVLYALEMKPGGYELEEVPEVFFRIVGRILG